jgi:VanZ family protein
MSSDPRNTNARRPDAGLRWAGRLLFATTLWLVTDLALQPGYATPARLFGSDKIEHILAFATLAVFVRLGWPRQPFWVGGLILLAYGLGIEVMQATDFIGRTASLADVAADLIGILFGIGVVAVFNRQMRR